RRHLGHPRLARHRLRGGRSLMAVRRLADPAVQPKSFTFTVENLDWAKGEIAKYPEGRQSSAIIALLWRAQEQAGGWLPQKAIAQINYDYYEDLTPETFSEILDDLAAGKPVKPGPQVARQLSAPSGGPTTLTDPALYSRGNGGKPQGSALHDAEAKKPGEPANV